MARTFYKRSSLARTLQYSDVSESDLIGSATSASFEDHVNRNNHNNESRTCHSLSSSRRYHQQSLQASSSVSRGLKARSHMLDQPTSQSFLNKEGGDSDDEDNVIVTDDSLSSAQSDFWSFFSWRKHLYFALSKPTHFDVEILASIATFGKGKSILLLLLPLLLAALASFFMGTWQQSANSNTQQGTVANLRDEENWLIMRWWPFNSFMWSFVPSSQLVSRECDTAHKEMAEDSDGIVAGNTGESLTVSVNQKVAENVVTEMKSQLMSREEMKLLIQEVVREENSQVLDQKSKQGKFTEKEMHKMKEEMHKMKEELSAFGLKFNSLSDLLDSFKSSLATNSETSSRSEKMSFHQSQQLKEMKEKLSGLENSIFESFVVAKNCCTNETLLDQKLAAMLLSILDDSDDNPLKPVQEWMSSRYSTIQQLEEKLLAIKQEMRTQEGLIAEHVRELKKQFLEDSHASVPSSSISLKDVHKIVKDAIMLYDADKTGETDFALESGGGAVVNTRCSETYTEGRPSLMLFGIPFWNVKSSPRNAIQPDLHPGQCWAFKGSQGFLVIELSATIRPTSFVIEHIPKSLSPTGTIDSAPKEFSVWGLDAEKDSEKKLLGEYTYDKDGEPLQKFPVQEMDVGYYSYVELQIHSNHGDLKYTCLYRFRVHGYRL